jgi:uncharacterized protein
MVITADFTNFRYPGVRVVEQDSGIKILQINSFNTIYMMGYAPNTVSDFGYKFVSSLADFKNQFVGSPSEPYVYTVFENDPNTELYFIPVGISDTVLLTIENATPGSLSLTINGEVLNYTILSGATVATVATEIRQLINTNANLSNFMTAYATSNTDEISVIADDFTTQITVTGLTANITSANVTITTPRARDYINSLTQFSAFGNYRQGFLIAPEAFSTLSLASDRQSLGNAMEDFVTEYNFDWCALIDKHPDILTVQELQTERNLYSSPLGHSWFYGTYIKALDDSFKPMSCYIAPLGTKMIRDRGIKKSIAGINYRLKDAKAVDVNFTDTQQGILADDQINIARVFDGTGVVAWDILTLSLDTNYSQHQGRVIMNVLNGTLRQIPGLYSYLFEDIDDQGVFLINLRNAIMGVLRTFWEQGALFGATEEEAFEVVCGFENNPDSQLQLGQVYGAVYAATTPNSRKILINVVKAPLGQVQTLATSGTRTTEA